MEILKKKKKKKVLQMNLQTKKRLTTLENELRGGRMKGRDN